jgi:hypothetical protein
MSKKNNSPIIVRISTKVANIVGQTAGVANEVKICTSLEYMCSKGEAQIKSDKRLEEAKAKYFNRIKAIRRANR